MGAPVLVTGASGFLGRALVKELVARGVEVSAMVRRSSQAEELQLLGVPLRYADLRDSDAVNKAVAGHQAVFHLAGATDVTDARLNHEINVEGARKLIEACRTAGCTRVINVSSTCAQRALRDAYGETKRAAEELFDGSGLAVTHFRPTMIYGPGSKEFEIFVRAVAMAPLVPLIAGGGARIQPSHRADAVGALITAWERPETAGRTYDLAGPATISFRELAQLIAKLIGRRRRILPIPAPLALLGARVMGRFIEHPPINVDQVMAFLQDTQVDIAPTRQDLGFDPRPMEQGLPSVLEKMGYRLG